MEKIMKSQKITWIMVGALLVIATIGLQPTWGQERNDPYAPTPASDLELSNPYAARAATGESPMIGVQSRSYWYFQNAPRASNDIRQAVEALQNAEKGEAHTKAEATLKDLLAKHFEADMQKRQAELKEMEVRLKKLQDQFARRQTKKDEIVDLQIKVLLNEAEGLGFFNNAAPSPFSQTPQGPSYFYSPRTTEEGRATIQPAPMPTLHPRNLPGGPEPTPAEELTPSAPIPSAAPLAPEPTR
jgi:hypothetical protein